MGVPPLAPFWNAFEVTADRAELDGRPLNINIKQKFQVHANWRLSVRSELRVITFGLKTHTDTAVSQYYEEYFRLSYFKFKVFFKVV